MPRIPSDREIKISALVHDKFPNTNLEVLTNIFKGELSEFNINNNPELVKEFESANKYRGELKSLSDEEINELHKPIGIKQEEENKKKIEKIENSLFHQTYMNADYEHWNIADYWIVDEFVALSFGKDPRKINKKYVENGRYGGSHTKDFVIIPFANKYLDRLVLVSRSVEQFIASDIKESTNQIFNKRPIEEIRLLPKYYLDWARKKNITLPKELIGEFEPTINSNKELLDSNNRLLEQNKELLKGSETLLEILKEKDKIFQISQDKNKKLTAELQSITDKFEKLKNEKVLGITDRKSLLKIIYGMAIDGYGWDPEAKRSPITKEITDIINNNCNQPITDDTVRKWFAEAKKLNESLDWED